MIYKAIYSIFSLAMLIFLTNKAQAVQICGKNIEQGQIMQGKAEGFKSIFYNNKEYPLTNEGDFLLAFDRDAKPNQKITLVDNKGQKKDYSLTIKKGAWDIQNLKGVPQSKVTPSKEDDIAINYERQCVRGAQTKDEITPYWKKGYIQPVEGRISGLFGGQRIMNGLKMNPHAGTDIAALEGTSVKASSDGIVTLAEPDLFYSGNVIVLDHGNSLFTIYAHLQKMTVSKGDKVSQGEVIGTVGKTGRVTGAHLHWGATLRGTRFNPFSLLNLNNNDNICLNL